MLFKVSSDLRSKVDSYLNDLLLEESKVLMFFFEVGKLDLVEA